MKRLLLAAVVILAVSSNLFAQSYGLGNADPEVFTKFRVPETHLSSFWFNTNLSFYSDKQAFKNPVSNQGNSNFNSEFNYSLTPHFYYLKENDDTRFNIDANVTGSYQHDYSESNGVYTGKANDSQLSLQLSGIYNNYYSSSEYFLSVGSDINVMINEDQKDYPGIYSDNGYSGTKSQSYNIYFGTGWGKIRNVTPVVTSIRFQERLKLLNLLNNDLDQKTIVDLAQQFSKFMYFGKVYDRPDKYFWGEIDKTLTKDGISLSGINQYGMLYLQETPNEYRFLRFEGLQTGINARLNYYNYYSSGSSWIQEQFMILGNVYLDYRHQLNLNSQIRATLNLSGGPNVTKPLYVKQRYDTNLVLEYDYELTDRIVASAQNSFTLTFLNANGQNKIIGNYLNLSAHYFIENNLDLNLLYSWNYYESEIANAAVNSLNDNRLQIGFTYYIDRGFIHP